MARRKQHSTVRRPQVLVLHGWQNRRPPGHWHRELVEALRSTGTVVCYPQLPDTEAPSLARWRAVATAALRRMRPPRVVVAHSLGVPTWLAAVQRAGMLPGDRVLLVAPPSPGYLRSQPVVSEFADVPLRLPPSSPVPRLVCTDADPYCPEGAAAVYAAVTDDVDLVAGGGHLTLDDGYGRWPDVIRWCADPTARIGSRR
jgi:predicted alpha/beta hydrolase family esterase